MVTYKQVKGGLLFVIDGSDGSLKNTNAKALVKNLENEGYDLQQREFPRYGHPAAFTSERYLNGDYLNSDGSKATSPMASSVTYAADRLDAFYGDQYTFKHNPELNIMVPDKVEMISMKKHFDQGGMVVSDRWTTANLGHQVGKAKTQEERDMLIKEIMHLEYVQCGLRKPDGVFIVNMPAETGYRLADNQKSQYTPGQDIHAADIGHLKNAVASFEQAAKLFNWHLINPLREGVDRNDLDFLSKAPLREIIRDKKDISDEIFEIAKTYLPK